jgi:hypothetical protein
VLQMQFNAKFVKSCMDNFGSDRREIFIAFAQSVSANSPHSHLIWCPLYLKNYSFILRIGISIQENFA